MIELGLVVIRFFRAFRAGFREHEFRNLFFLVVTILLVGTIFYHNLEGWSYLDALYFSVTTLTTVGLGDFTPKSTIGKVFTIIYIIAGISIILGFIDALAIHTKNQSSFPNFSFFKRRFGKHK